MRKTSLNEYSQILKKYQNDNSLTNDFDSIVFSIIHMHCNRLLKGRDMEYLTMVLVRHTLFDLAYLKKEK
jgi:thiopeptide-type bacteriocin biosynthesis protein